MCKRLLFFLFSLCVVGCNLAQTQRSCDAIVAADFHKLLKQPQPAEEMRTQLAEIYEVPLAQITLSPDNNGFGGLGATKDGTSIRIITLKGVPLIGAMQFHTEVPTADKLIACLGSPQLYRAYYRASFRNQLEFEMYFLDKGIQASTIQSSDSKVPPRVDGGILMPYIDYAPIVPAEEMLDQLNVFQGKEFQELVRKQVKPWPGRWENIEIDIDPALR